MENNNRMNLAEEVRTRIMNSLEQKRQAERKAAEEAAKKFASELKSMKVRLKASEIKEMWPQMPALVLAVLEEEGFDVNYTFEDRRTGFLGWKKETVWFYEISIPTNPNNKPK